MKSDHIAHTVISKVVIAGCGHLGKKVLHGLVSRDLIKTEDIIALVSTEYSQGVCSAKGIETISIDLDETDIILADIFKTSATLLYYFIAPPRRGKTDSRVAQFIRQLKQSQSYSPAKVVLISTTGVYGNCQGQWVDENQPLKPQVDRAIRRRDAEQQFQSYCRLYDIPLVILRVSGIYGPGKLPLKRIREKIPIVCQQDSPYSNRIHIDDLLEICIEAGLREDIRGIFNCADGHPTTMYDYFMQLAQANHLPQPEAISLAEARNQLSAGMLSYMDESRRINNQKLLHIFDLKLKHPYLTHENLRENL